MSAEPTYTYRDNPYPNGTKEHDVWYTGFVHGLNSETRQNSHILDLLEYQFKTELVKREEKHDKENNLNV